MSRFSNLEFGADRAPATPEPQGEPTRDKHYFLGRGVASWLAGDFEAGLRNFSRSLEEDSTFFDGWLGQVRMLIELSEYPEAIVWSNKALELFPDDKEILSAKAVAAVRQDDLEMAREMTDSAVAKGNATYYVWIARAEVLLAYRSGMAQTCVRNAVSIAGNDAPLARLEAGRALLRADEFGSALEFLGPAVKDLPQSALAWYELGRCQAALGFAEARSTLSHCLTLRPNWREADAALQGVRRGGMFSWWRGRR